MRVICSLDIFYDRHGCFNKDIGKRQQNDCGDDIEQGLEITFDADSLKFFTQWKMMGERDYVLGLEPGNCTPDGRDRVRADGNLTVLAPGESVSYEVHVTMLTEPAE